MAPLGHIVVVVAASYPRGGLGADTTHPAGLGWWRPQTGRVDSARLSTPSPRRLEGRDPGVGSAASSEASHLGLEPAAFAHGLTCSALCTAPLSRTQPCGLRAAHPSPLNLTASLKTIFLQIQPLSEVGGAGIRMRAFMRRHDSAQPRLRSIVHPPYHGSVVGLSSSPVMVTAGWGWAARGWGVLVLKARVDQAGRNTAPLGL